MGNRIEEKNDSTNRSEQWEGTANCRSRQSLKTGWLPPDMFPYTHLNGCYISRMRDGDIRTAADLDGEVVFVEMQAVCQSFTAAPIHRRVVALALPTRMDD
jgi:hypothetical protein